VGKRYGVGVPIKGNLAVGVAVGVKRKVSVDVGRGVALGVKDGSRQAGIESTRAEGSRVYPNWS
jgi:hypothetical protein